MKRLWESWDLSKPFEMPKEREFREKAMLRHPARDPAELGAFVLAQINEVERSLLFQSQHFFRWRNASRSATFRDAGELLASAQLEQAIFGKLLVGHATQGTFV